MHVQTITFTSLLSLAAASDNVYGNIFAGGSQSAPDSTSAELTPVPTVGTIVTDGSGSTIVAPLPPGNPGYPTAIEPAPSGYPTEGETETQPSATSEGGYPTEGETETQPSATSEGGYPTSAPLETIPSVIPIITGTGSAPGYPTSVATTPLTNPLGAGNGTYPTGPIGNLSTTVGSATTSAGSGGSGGSGGGSGGSGGSGGGSTVLITTTGAGGEPVTQTSIVAVEPTGEGGAGGAGASGGAGESGSVQPGAANSLQAGAALAMAVFAGMGAFLL